MTGFSKAECPWCGRALTLSRSGVSPRHKRVTGTHIVTGAPVRAWCPGSSELPWALHAEQRRQLRSQWRDDAGELRGGDDGWN
jgi:hypothetical protein